MKAFVKFILIIYAILSTGAYILSCFAPLINPCHSSIVYFSGLAFPFILINFTVISLYLGIFKKKFLFLFFLIPGILFGLNYLALNQSEGLSGEDLVIYTFNAHSGKLLEENETEFQKWKSYAQEESNQADIICLQEFHKGASIIFPGTENFHVFSKEKSHLKIASRYRIISGGELKDTSGLRFAIYGDLLIKEDTVRVYNFHLYSNNITAWLKTAEETESHNPKQYISGGDQIKKRVFDAANRRATQAKKLKWHINASPFHVIACGDMNETPQTFSYRQIKGRLIDTFKKGNIGVHPTYRKNPSWVRIDYILAEKNFSVNSFEVLPFAISDHYVVKAKLK